MNRTTIAATAALAVSIQCGVSLAAQQRSFVSTGGSDAAACTLAAPCRSFGAALPHTLDNGEIVALDSGGYGAVVVDKSVELIAPPGVYAAITASSGTGIQVVAPAAKVAIRGIAINGLDSGQFGIDIQSGDVVVERCHIANFAQDGLRASGFDVAVRDSDIRDNGHNGVTLSVGSITLERTALVANTNNGIDATASVVTLANVIVSKNGSRGAHLSGNIQATVTNSEIVRNATDGFFVDGGVASSWLRVAIEHSNVSANGSAGIYYFANGSNAKIDLSVSRTLFLENFTGMGGGVLGGTYAKVFVTDSVFERNAQAGISIDGTGAELTIASNTVTGSSQGVAKFGSASIFTRLSNTVRGNTTDVQNGPLTSFGGT